MQRPNSRRRVPVVEALPSDVAESFALFGTRWLSARSNCCHERGDYDDRLRNIMAVPLPQDDVAPDQVSCLVVCFTWRDQGWGNRKSMLYLGGAADQQRFPLSADVADHHDIQSLSLWNPRMHEAVPWWPNLTNGGGAEEEGPAERSAAAVPISAIIGGGGGHEIFVKGLHIGVVPRSKTPELFYVLCQLRWLDMNATESSPLPSTSPHLLSLPDDADRDSLVLSDRLFLRHVASLPDGPLMWMLTWVAPLDHYSFLARRYRSC